jgi:ubiquinone/menaquinone biosynthesis C-methylase UbiE
LSVSDHEQAVIRYYTERTDDFYLSRWDNEDIHFGIFLEGEFIDIDQYKTGHSEILKRAVQRMTETVTSPGQILPTDLVVDAGCGVGGTAIHLAKTYGCRVRGINICQHQIDIAKEKAKQAGLTELIQFEFGDCSNSLPIDDNSVDVVVNIESACHYSNRAKFIEECARILKAGGRLVAQDVIARDEIDQSTLIRSACDAWAMHYPLETFQSYRHVLEKNGFEVAELIEIEGFKPTIDLMDQSLKHLRRFAESGGEFVGDEKLWMRQFETMAGASYAGHLTLLRYHARLPIRK